MSPQVASWLALILFLPWFSILAALFWLWPRGPRHARRIAFDAASLALALLAAAAGMRWSLADADPRFGPMWPQVLATSVAYGAFLGVLTAAWLLRRARLRRTPSSFPLPGAPP